MRHPARLQLRAAVAIFSASATAGWAILGLLVVAFAGALASASPHFGYAYDVADMPVPALVAGLVAAGLVFCIALPPLIRSSLAADAATVRRLMLGIILAGLAARLVLFASEPMLEDDYQRYLWDGAVTAAGINPYAVAPQTARGLAPDTALGRLAVEAGPLVRRINHPDLKTIYPPVAQAAFALAHMIRPWSLTAWRAVVLACDLATLGLVLALLREAGRSPLWSALYWWNPLPIKELFNSAHMDVLLLPLVLLALLLTVRRRQLAAVVGLTLAVGAKIWPVLLLPLLLRPLAAKPQKLAATLLIFGGLAALLAAPVVLGGLAGNSGFTSYLTSWHTSSALFPLLESASTTLLGLLGASGAPAGLVARVAIAATLGGFACTVSLKPIAGADDLLGRASLVVAALVLLSPAQFPWYAVWLAPFLAFRPWSGFLVLSATAPLYYMSFYLTAAGDARAVPTHHRLAHLGTRLGHSRHRSGTIPEPSRPPPEERLMRHGSKISVVIPALNEEQAIGRVIADIPAWVDEIVVVDNGSHDGTARAARSAGARVVGEPERGYGAACQAGISALDSPDIVVFLDGDYSDQPEEMSALVDPIARRDADFVVGSRVRGKRGRGALTPQQRFGNWLACRLIRRIWGTSCSDLGPFRAISASSTPRPRPPRPRLWLDRRDAAAGGRARARLPGGTGQLPRAHWRIEDIWNRARLGARRHHDPLSHRPLRVARIPVGVSPTLSRVARCAPDQAARAGVPRWNRKGARSRSAPWRRPAPGARPCQAKMPPARSSTLKAPCAFNPSATREASRELLTPTEQ